MSRLVFYEYMPYSITAAFSREALAHSFFSLLSPLRVHITVIVVQMMKNTKGSPHPNLIRQQYSHLLVK